MSSFRDLLLLLVWFSLPSLYAGEEEVPSKVSLKTEKPFTSKSTAVNRIAALPNYASTLDGELDWIDFGIESRSRFEARDQDCRTASTLTESVFFQRSLVYLGIHDVLDPFRFGAEFEDSRREISNRPPSGNEANHTELLQAFGELYLDDTLGGEPLSLRFGRMTMDAVDRRLLARNRFRNTISAFDGVRLRLGKETSPIEWDTFALRTVNRSVTHLDKSTTDNRLYGVTGYIRTLSPNVIIEPYWLLADDQLAAGGKHLHTSGVHAYGQIGDSAWDYDFDFAGQWGESGGLDHQAWAAHAEIGHIWDHPWKPRLAAWLNFASGDHDPGDGKSGRFDPLYGASFSFYGYTSYFAWQNMINPALHLSFRPHEKLLMEVIHRGVWLASEQDGWARGGRFDPSGTSGRFVGQELDVRAVWKAYKHLEFETGYSCFFPGEFVSATGSSSETHFGYIAATIRY